MIYRIISIIFTSVFLITPNCVRGNPKLATSSASLDSSVASSKSVMLCRLVDLGGKYIGSYGEVEYDASFETRAQFKGTSPQRVICSFKMRNFPPEDREEAPQVGKDYIVAASPGGDVLVIQKIVAATPENIAEVKALIGGSAEAVPLPPTQVPVSAPSVSAPLATSHPPLTSAATVARSKSVWPWFVGIAAIAVITLLVWKRRANK